MKSEVPVAAGDSAVDATVDPAAEREGAGDSGRAADSTGAGVPPVGLVGGAADAQADASATATAPTSAVRRRAP